MIDEGNKPDFIVLVMNCQSLSCRLEGEGVFAGSGKRHADFCRGVTLKLNCRAVCIDSAPLLHGQGLKLCDSLHSRGHELSYHLYKSGTREGRV